MSIFSFLGGVAQGGLSMWDSANNRKFAEQQNQQNYLAQKEFAQNGIQWRVADAKKAGLHPLYALGGAGAGYSPTSSAFSGADFSGVGNGIAQLGGSFLSKQEKEANALVLEGKKLDNDLKKAELAQLQAANTATSGSIGVTGQGSSIIDKPSLSTAGKHQAFTKTLNNGLLKVGEQYGVSLEHQPDGSLRVYPSPDSVSGQKASEGSFMNKIGQILDSFQQVPALVKELNKKGLAGKGYRFSYKPFLTDGGQLHIIREPDKPKYKSTNFGHDLPNY